MHFAFLKDIATGKFWTIWQGIESSLEVLSEQAKKMSY